jgi:hypothetical protein
MVHSETGILVSLLFPTQGIGKHALSVDAAFLAPTQTFEGQMPKAFA